MTWKLWLDDQSFDPATPARHAGIDFAPAVSSKEAIHLVKEHGPPEFMDLDHDLGGDDTAMTFLKWLAETHPESCPRYLIHSENGEGRKNIDAFMNSWRRSMYD